MSYLITFAAGFVVGVISIIVIALLEVAGTVSEMEEECDNDVKM